MIYKAVAGTARVLGIDGEHQYSQTFDIRRGVIQGDILSPIFFVLALDQLFQDHDTKARDAGVKVGTIGNIRVLGYADDATLIDGLPKSVTARLTTFADAAIEKADMYVKPAKTFSHIVEKQKSVGKATEAEVAEVELSYKHPCSFADAGCTARFKTETAMQVHRATCTFNYATTNEVYEVEEIRDVFGRAERKLFKVKWAGYAEDDADATSWEPERLLLRDGCKDSIDDFWLRNKLNPAADYYPSRDGKQRCWVCGWDTDSKRPGVLKAHLTRAKHHWHKQERARTHAQAVKDVKGCKLKAMQQAKPHVYWHDVEVKNY